MVSSIAGAGAPDAPRDAVKTGPYPWIVNPVIDFLFVFGGLVWVLIGINLAVIGWSVPVDVNASAPVGKLLIIASLIGQHVFADAHTAATYIRIFPTEEARSRFDFFVRFLPFALIPVFAYGLMAPGGAGDLVYLYIITVFWHYSAQSFGISLIYCYKRGYILKPREREIYRWFIYSMIAFSFVRMMTFREYSPQSFYGVKMPWWGPLPEWMYHFSRVGFILMTVAFAWVILSKFARERKLPPIPSVVLIGTVAAIGFSEGTLNSLLWMYGPPFFHGSQYIAVSLAYYLKEKEYPQGLSPVKVAKIFWKPETALYMGLLILSGVFIYVGIPHIFNQLGYDFAMVGGVCLAVFNFHHFATDAAIWRMKDPKQREILLA